MMIDEDKYFVLSPHIFYEDEKLKYGTFAVINRIQDDNFSPRFRFKEETIHCSTDQFYQLDKRPLGYVPFFRRVARLIEDAKQIRDKAASTKAVVEPLNDDNWPSEFSYASYMPRIQMFISTRVNYKFHDYVGASLLETVQFLPLQIFVDEKKDKEEFIFGLMYFKTLEKKEKKCRAILLDKTMIDTTDWHELNDKRDYLLAPSPLDENFMKIYGEEILSISSCEGGLFPTRYYFKNMYDDAQTSESPRNPISISTNWLISFSSIVKNSNFSFKPHNFPNVIAYVTALLKGDLYTIKIHESVRDFLDLILQENYRPIIDEFLNNCGEKTDIYALLNYVYEKEPFYRKNILNMINKLAALDLRQVDEFVKNTEEFIKSQISVFNEKINKTYDYNFMKYFKGGKNHGKN